MVDPVSKNCRGYGFVTFSSAYGVHKALGMNGITLEGKSLIVEEKLPNNPDRMRNRDRDRYDDHAQGRYNDGARRDRSRSRSNEYRGRNISNYDNDRRDSRYNDRSDSRYNDSHFDDRRDQPLRFFSQLQPRQPL